MKYMVEFERVLVDHHDVEVGRETKYRTVSADSDEEARAEASRIVTSQDIIISITPSKD